LHQRLGAITRDSSDLWEERDRFGCGQIEQPLERVLRFQRKSACWALIRQHFTHRSRFKSRQPDFAKLGRTASVRRDSLNSGCVANSAVRGDFATSVWDILRKLQSAKNQRANKSVVVED
jgi:hypothetical protein